MGSTGLKLQGSWHWHRALVEVHVMCSQWHGNSLKFLHAFFDSIWMFIFGLIFGLISLIIFRLIQHKHAQTMPCLVCHRLDLALPAGLEGLHRLKLLPGWKRSTLADGRSGPHGEPRCVGTNVWFSAECPGTVCWHASVEKLLQIWQDRFGTGGTLSAMFIIQTPGGASRHQKAHVIGLVHFKIRSTWPPRISVTILRNTRFLLMGHVWDLQPSIVACEKCWISPAKVGIRIGSNGHRINNLEDRASFKCLKL